MTSYIYIPVPTDDMRKDARTWVTGQKEKNKTPCVILAHTRESGKLKGLVRGVRGASGLGLLRKVSSTDKLYILAHGFYETATSAGPNALGAPRDGDQKLYSPAGLAKVVEEEGLTKQASDIRLFACGSGVDVPGGAWASRFKDEMVALGFGRVAVTGYLGDVRPSYVERQTAGGGGYTPDKHKGIEMDGFIYPASQHKYQF